jgi:hypothetical protein
MTAERRLTDASRRYQDDIVRALTAIDIVGRPRHETRVATP